MIRTLAKRAAVVAAASAVTVTMLAGTASANTQVGYVGDHQANNWTAVWCVQHDINHFAQNSWYPHIDEDGYWGPKTKNAVVWFQGRLISGAKYADGIVGPRTGDLLLGYGDEDQDAKCRAALPTSS
ncbi:peptidoglycan-binding protein [Kitasatospora sp. NPDC004745]|uniref:peptidoglycan-binding domain-containing protein n=1 Tax=Kitasatospora sp. NPDC004745 TaxID=3364019 RepID=UPI0036C7E227